MSTKDASREPTPHGGDLRPRIRTIKPEFFDDDRINSLGVGSRYVAVGLISAADDRGRMRRVAALRTHVFPRGDVSERQFDKALDEIVTTGFVWQYEAAGQTYLWMPRFWKHQRINRPSESDLPPHPDDPDGALPITQALSQFTERSRNHSRNDHGGLTTSRVGARSVPFLDVEVVEVVQRLCDRLAARMRANDPKADPKPESGRWQTDMRLLLDDREWDVSEVERIIDWCQADPFWRSNILSPGKLRRQFTQLVLRAKGGQVVPMRRESASDILRALNDHPRNDFIEGTVA